VKAPFTSQPLNRAERCGPFSRIGSDRVKRCNGGLSYRPSARSSRLGHASLQTSDLSRSGLASEAGLKAPPEAVAWWRPPFQPLRLLGWAENSMVTPVPPLNGLEMNSCAVDGLVVPSGVSRYQYVRMSDPNVKTGPTETRPPGGRNWFEAVTPRL
jgi:hypothetical protein